jgi:hypothetical protein
MKRYDPRVWYASRWTKAEVAAVWWASTLFRRQLSDSTHSHLANLAAENVLSQVHVAGLVPRALFRPGTIVQKLEDVLERERLVISSWDHPDRLLAVWAATKTPKVCTFSI